MYQQWHELHKPIMHNDCLPICEEVKKPPKIPPCWQVGFCLCGKRGRSTSQMRAWFYAALKQATKKNTLGRQL
eukprot:2789088-Pyramimonas_sp.AAC.1